MAILTQVDVDAVWLASRIDFQVPGVPADLQVGARARLRDLLAAGTVTQELDHRPVLT